MQEVRSALTEAAPYRKPQQKTCDPGRDGEAP
jgi:hypothetical protein